MKNIYDIKDELVDTLNSNKYIDLSDIGNIIGIVISKYFDNEEIGFEKDDFYGGIEHGISITDGTHDL